MIAELERVGQQRSKGEADFSDLYDRLTHVTQTCRQAVTKRLAIITSLVEYYSNWQLVCEEYYPGISLMNLIVRNLHPFCHEFDCKKCLSHLVSKPLVLIILV